jgi:16S rRNA pseudouridine516 synthase
VKLAKYLANLGYGSRRDAMALVAAGRVTDAADHRVEEGAVFAHDALRIDGEPLDPAPGAVIVLHKPVGYTCSTTDPGATIYELVPERFRRRKPMIAPVGRLDRDSSGLLLLTDDGALLHRITAPRSHLPKVYEATLAQPLRGDEAAVFMSGAMMLKSDPSPLAPAMLHVLEPRRARVTVTEGRYHQIRRMFAAVGNHVTALHRTGVGGLALGDLGVGKWRVLDRDEIDRIFRTDVGEGPS